MHNTMTWRPSRWQLWTLPRPASSLVLAVVVAALAISAASVVEVPTISRTELIRFAILLGGSILHLEAARGIERRRELAGGNSPYTNLKSIWITAALVLIPLPLVIAVAVVSHVYCWFRVFTLPVAHRKVYSGATYILATAAADAVLRGGGLAAHPRLPTGPWQVVILAAAALMWWLINYALVVGVIALASPNAPARDALGNLADQLVVAAALGLGVVIGALLGVLPWAACFLLAAVLCVHRDLLLPQYERAARTDPKTGLATALYWASEVTAALKRAALTDTPLGVLLLDFDHFKEINDIHGHTAGDEAIAAVAAAVRHEVRGEDLVGRYGGDELVIMLPGVSRTELCAVAERIRGRIEYTPTTLTRSFAGPVPIRITASIGAAAYPEDGATADQLLIAADEALLAAKRGGRNRSAAASERDD